MAGTISKRSTNTWIVRIFLGRDANGRTRHFNKTIRGTKKDAQRFLTAKLRERDLGGRIDSSTIRVEEYLATWLSDIARPRVREATFDGYKDVVRLYLSPELGFLRLCDLRPDHIQGLYGVLQREGLSARTIRYAHSVLSSALGHALRQGMIVTNPCSICDLPRGHRQEMKYLGPDEVRAFLDVVSNTDHHALFVFAIETGLRPSEYLALRWSDVDLVAGTASVRRTVKERRGGGFYFSSPKTAKGNRLICLSNNLTRLLRLHKGRQREAMMKVRNVYAGNDLIFANEIGNPLCRKNLTRRVFEPALKNAGLMRIRLYDLRHTSATLLLAAGEHPKVVSERLGHSSSLLTLDTYSHVLPHMQKEAASRIEKMMIGG